MFNPLRWLPSELSKLNQTLSKTKQLHAFIITTHLSHDPFYATKLTTFYAINNDLASARNLFDGIPDRSIYLWNSIIRAYAKAHQFGDAFQLFRRMLTSETRPDNFTFACLSRAFSDRFDVAGLRVVHGGLIVSGLGLDSIASSALVTAYSKVGLVDDAVRVFAGMIDPDLVLWNSMISGYGSYGDWDKGMHLFAMMRRVGKQPDGYTMVGLMSGLTDPSLLGIARGIHGFCYKIGLDSNAHVGTVLVSMYSKCKCLTSAFRVFDDLSHPDLVTWSALITGFSRSGDNEMALRFFHRMNTGGRKADSVLIASALAATAKLAIVRPGIEIHGYAVRHYFDWEVIVSSALVDMYSKCGSIGLGIKVFKNMPQRNIVSYNSVIACFGLYGCASEAFEMFRGMLEEGLKPDETTFSALLCACCHAGLVNEGRAIFRRMEDEFGIIPVNLSLNLLKFGSLTLVWSPTWAAL